MLQKDQPPRSADVTDATSGKAPPPGRVTLAIASLCLGGAQRALTRMANWWSEHGVDTTILTFDNPGDEPFYPLHPDIRVRRLGLALRSGNALQALRNNLQRLSCLRQAIGESAPDAVVSFIDTTNVLVLLATLGLGLPVLVAERTDPAQHHIGRLWDLLRRGVYPRAGAVVAQTAAAAAALPRGRDGMVHVIPNPVEAPEPGVDPPCRRQEILSVGRFSPEKGMDLLLRAFAQANLRHPGWRLVLVGDGPCRNTLQEQARKAGLEQCVTFTGAVEDVYPLLQGAAIFALPSRYEGFPNALCEAMACGLPAVVTATTGALAVVRHGVDGLVAPIDDQEAFSRNLLQLMADEDLRNQLGNQARGICQRHGVEDVMGSWNRLLARVIQRG